VNSNFASSSIGQPNIAWPRPSTGPQVFTGLPLLVEFALAILEIAINQWNLAFLMSLISGIWCR
jgi:hypothetical protein